MTRHFELGSQESQQHIRQMSTKASNVSDKTQYFEEVDINTQRHCIGGSQPNSLYFHLEKLGRRIGWRPRPLRFGKSRICHYIEFYEPFLDAEKNTTTGVQVTPPFRKFAPLGLSTKLVFQKNAIWTSVYSTHTRSSTRKDSTACCTCRCRHQTDTCHTCSLSTTSCVNPGHHL